MPIITTYYRKHFCSILSGLRTCVPTGKKALFEAWKRQIAEMANLGIGRSHAFPTILTHPRSNGYTQK